MHRGFLLMAFILAAVTVALGAFGAHGLKSTVSDTALNTFETGVRYQFYHVFAIMVAGILYKEYPFAPVKWAGWLFLAGIILFSGSLYFLTFLQATVKPGYRWIGAITPFGGLCFIGGWLLLCRSLMIRK